MNEKTKKLLCKAGYFERLPKEEEMKIHPERGIPEGVFCWYNEGPGPAYYAYYVKDEEIDLKDAELFLRQKHYRAMKVCAVIGAACAVVGAVCFALITRVVFL